MAAESFLQGLRPIQVIRAFQRLGYAVERVGGGHFVLEHPSRPPFQVPYRAMEALAAGLIRAQIRVAGVAEAEFETALAETAALEQAPPHLHPPLQGEREREGGASVRRPD